MQNFKYSNQLTSSSSSDVSSRQSQLNRIKSPVPSDYEYLGRLVTRERPIARKSNSISRNIVFPRNKHQNYYSMGSKQQDIYEDISISSNDDEVDGLSKPLGVIRINDRHLREIYRLPTPPPKIKRVYHRLRSPEPKVIERVFVRRPPPQIIENIIEVPPEKVRIINREKHLPKQTPITRSKLIHLKSHNRYQYDEPFEEQPQQQQQQQQDACVSSGQCCQRPTTVPSHTAPQHSTVPSQAAPQHSTATAVGYPPQTNLRTVGYIESTIPPHIMFSSQQPVQIAPGQFVQPLPPQGSIPQIPQRLTNFNYPQQPIPYNHTQQPIPYNHIQQPIPYNYPQQPTVPHTSYGYPQF